MLRIAFSTLAGRKAGAVGAFVGVVLATVLAGSMAILLQSSLRVPIGVERLQQASIIVEGPTTIAPGRGEGTVAVPILERSRIDESVTDRLRGIDGVHRVIADRSVYASLVGGDGRLYRGANGASTIGHGWESAELTPYAIVAGAAPRRESDVAVDARAASSLHLHVGSRVRVLTIEGSSRFVVSGIAAAPSAAKVPAQGALFVRNDVAERLSDAPGRVDLVGIVPRRGVSVDRLSASITARVAGSGLRVLTGAERGDAESAEDAIGRDEVVAGLTVFAALAAFVALFVVSSTFSLSVQQRHRELALFRAIGSTPRQVRRLVAGEALLVALAAFVVSLPLSVVAAHLERGLFARAGMVPAGLRLVVGWLPFVAALVAALVTTQVAAYASARRASRIRPTDALRESAGPSRRFSLLRLGVGLAALGGGIATLAVAAHGGGLAESEAPAAGYLTLAAALLGPVLARPFVFCGGWLPAATGSAPALLAWANGRANLRRVASVATPVMVAVSVVGTTYVAKSLLQQETHVQTHRRTSADFVLQASSAEGLPTAVEDAARHISGVTSVTGTVATTAVVAGDGHLVSVPARTVVPGAIGRGLALEVAAGSLEHVRDDGVAVSVRSAHDWGWRLGERVRIRLGDGSAVGVRVVAEYRRPLGFGELVLPRALVAGHVTRPLDDAVYVTAAPAGRRDVEHALRDLRGTYPTLRVLTPDSYVAQIDAAGTKEALEVYVLLALIVLFCALGLVNALTMAVGARSREFATLLLIGATRRQVRSMVRTETLTTLAFGLIVGSLVAFPGLALLEHSLRGSWRPSIPVWTCLGLFASYAVIGMAATVIPLRAALRAATAGAAS